MIAFFAYLCLASGIVLGALGIAGGAILVWREIHETPDGAENNDGCDSRNSKPPPFFPFIHH